MAFSLQLTPSKHTSKPAKPVNSSLDISRLPLPLFEYRHIPCHNSEQARKYSCRRFMAHLAQQEHRFDTQAKGAEERRACSVADGVGLAETVVATDKWKRSVLYLCSPWVSKLMTPFLSASFSSLLFLPCATSYSGTLYCTSDVSPEKYLSPLISKCKTHPSRQEPAYRRDPNSVLGLQG